jgi:hypothetical protein
MTGARTGAQPGRTIFARWTAPVGDTRLWLTLATPCGCTAAASLNDEPNTGYDRAPKPEGLFYSDPDCPFADLRLTPDTGT